MTSRPLTEHQFCTLEILARRPRSYRLVWSGCGAAGFGYGSDPADRDKCGDLILSIPLRYRWPCTNTILSLERRGLIKEVKATQYFFWTVFKITRAGLDAYAFDPAFDRLTAPERVNGTEDEYAC
jgi:hypothetical protein